MNRRSAALLLASIFLLALVALFVRRGPSERSPVDATEETVAPVEGETVTVQLYFPDNTGGLTRETREIAATRDLEARLGAILDQLIAGPTAENRFPPLDPPPGVGSVHVSDEGTAYVDLVSSELASPPVSGTRDELLTIYSFVNSLLLNTPEVESVVFLWNGQQLESFAGHIDTTRPLVANPNL